MKVFALLALISCCFALNHRLNLGSDRVFRLYDGQITDKTMLAKIMSEVDVWGTQQDGGIDVRTNPSVAKLLAGAGVNISDVTDFHMDHFDWMDTNDQICTKSAEECATGDSYYTQYQTLAAIHQRFQGYAQSSSKAELYSWGTSHENRDMLGLSIKGDVTYDADGNEKAKDVVFYFCGEHAREWLPPMFCSWMAEQLLADAEVEGSTINRLLRKNYDFYILPVMNPDGYTFSMSGNNMWRKSRKPNAGSSCIGTDLNRNYGYQWNTGGSSSNPCSDVYHGTESYDNLETAAMKNFYETHNVVVQTDVHAFGQMWMHPYGWTRALSPDDAAMSGAGLATVNAIRSVHGLSFAHGSIANVIYVASGSSCDDFYGNGGVIFSYAPEVRGSSFQPPASNIIPSNAELYAGMVAQVEYVEGHFDSK